MALNRIVQHYGQCLSIAGASLTSSYQGGTAIALEGTEEVEVVIVGVGGNGSAGGAMNFRITESDDLVNWDPVASLSLSASGGTTPAVDHALTIAANTTVRDRLQVLGMSAPTHRMAKYMRVEVKFASVPVAGDSGTASLNFDI